nr:YciI family protein [Marinobacterium ramblicola]
MVKENCVFIVSLTYKCELSEIDTYLNDHVEYLDRQYAAGVFLASGRKVPRTGGVILARADSRQQLEQILAEDPFSVHNLAEYDVIEFVPSKTSKELEFLCQ